MENSLIEKLPEIKNTNREMIARAAEIAANIVNAEKYKEAGEIVLGIKRRLKWWGDLIDPMIKKAWESHREAVKVRTEVSEPLEKAKDIIGNSMARFDEEQRRKANEEEERLRKEMRKSQEDTIINVAASLEKDGHSDVADALLQTPISDVKVNVEVATVNGISYTTRYHAEVYDLKELIKAIVRGEVPLVAVKPDLVFLNKQASALKSELRYPGVKSVETRTQNIRV